MLGTIPDLESAFKWVKTTFFWQRITQNPKHYGVKHGAGVKDYVLKKLEDAICELKSAGLIEFEASQIRRYIV